MTEIKNSSDAYMVVLGVNPEVTIDTEDGMVA